MDKTFTTSEIKNPTVRSNTTGLCPTMIVLWKSKDLPTAQITIPIKHFKTKVILSGMTASPRDGAEQIKPAT